MDLFGQGLLLWAVVNTAVNFYVHGTVHHLSVLNKPTRCSWVVYS